MILALILGALAMTVGPTAHGDDSVTFTGTVALREPGVLPAGAVLTVTLEDVARADAPAVTLAQTRIELTGQAPVPFALSYPRTAVTPQGIYAARARVSAGDRLLFTTTERYRVDAANPAPAELLLDAVPGADVSLTDTYWKLLEVAGTPVSVTEAMREPSLVLHGADGRFAGSGGVNRLLGGYTLAGESLTFTPVASTMMAGPPEAMAQEQAIVAALGRVRGFGIAGDRLTMLDESGQPVLTAVAVALR